MPRKRDEPPAIRWYQYRKAVRETGPNEAFDQPSAMGVARVRVTFKRDTNVRVLDTDGCEANVGVSRDLIAPEGWRVDAWHVLERTHHCRIITGRWRVIVTPPNLNNEIFESERMERDVARNTKAVTNWEGVDWSENNNAIAKKLGVSRKRVATQRWRKNKRKPKRNVRLQELDERHAEWARIANQFGATFTIPQIAEVMRDNNEPWDRVRERAKYRVLSLVSHGAVVKLGRGEDNRMRYGVTMRGRLLAKAYERNDRSEWDAILGKEPE